MTDDTETSFKSLAIPAEDFDRHQDRKEELGVTWAEYLDGVAPEPFDVAEVREAARKGVEEALEQWTWA